MAALRSVFQNFKKQYNYLTIQRNVFGSTRDTCQNHGMVFEILKPQPPNLSCWRSSHTFLIRLTAEDLWKSATSLSNAGRRKGRGRGGGRKVAKDLNKGQILGVGKKNMLWPGLNAPIVQGREVVRQQELPFDENREKKLFELRDKMGARKRFSLHPLERGWSGTKLPGRSLGPPDAVGEDTFEGFDSKVLMFTTVSHMTGKRGRVRRFNALCVVGNKNGLAGFALGRNVNAMSAAVSAKNKAAKVLRYIERDNDTILHDFFSEYGAMKVFAEKRPAGHGLCCHRVLRAICEMVGIKDLYAKVEGPKNIQCLTRAFFIGLMTQKSLQQIADEKGLYVLERRRDRENFPVVVAAPKKCRTEEEIDPTELLDFKLHVHNNKVVQPRKKYIPHYINKKAHIKATHDKAFRRNFDEVRLRSLAKYGEITSFLQIREKEKAQQELKETVES